MTAEIRDAIRRFQERERLPVDGIVGPDTERALIAARGGKTIGTGDKQPTGSGEFDELDTEFADFELEDEVNRRSLEYIRWVQQSLNKILGLRLTEDGIIGRQTRSAISSFQQRQGLKADGIVGSRTEAALIASGALPPPQMTTPSVPIPAGRPDIVNVRGIRVARQIASQVEALLATAEVDGIRLGGGGYRSPEAQVELRKKHCGTTHYDIYEKPASRCTPPTAPPGKSMHEKGLAIDFTYNGRTINSRDNPGFQWLSRNASRFGLYNLPSEPWHWSVNGR
jgi:peptidoglycan hydrolase-like protein with peptidoglycan-binding domain